MNDLRQRATAHAASIVVVQPIVIREPTCELIASCKDQCSSWVKGQIVRPALALCQLPLIGRVVSRSIALRVAIAQCRGDAQPLTYGQPCGIAHTAIEIQNALVVPLCQERLPCAIL